jgi:hypothetical protein
LKSESKDEKIGYIFPTGKIKVSIHPGQVVVGRYCLRGRGSRTVHADEDKVVKVSWPEASRSNEAEILHRALEIGSTDQAVEGHIPKLFNCHDFDQFSTDLIRNDLGIADPEKKGVRRMCILLLNRLRPITELVGDEFCKAF